MSEQERIIRLIEATRPPAISRSYESALASSEIDVQTALRHEPASQAQAHTPASQALAMQPEERQMAMAR